MFGIDTHTKNGFSEQDTHSMRIKTNNKQDFMKSKAFCAATQTIIQENGSPQDEENY